MTYEEAIKKVEIMCDEWKEILNTLKEKENKPKRWKPENKQEYWFINSGGEIRCEEWFDINIDKKRYKSGNCYRTEEECKFAAECMLVERELQNYADEHNEGEIIWGGDNPNFSLCYDHSSDKIRTCSFYVSHQKDVYFTSYEVARGAVETIGEARLKKYYFKIGEKDNDER
jgi:hypothetical protein